MKKLLLILALFSAAAFGQNVRYDEPFPSITAQYSTPFLVANIPPNSPILSVCSVPANAVPCTNFVTTFNSAGVPCANGSQDTPQPQPSACQSTGDAQGNIGFWAPPGAYDYTVCIANNCFGPYRVTLGGTTTGAVLQVNGVLASSQTLQNLEGTDSNGVNPVDNGGGAISFNLKESSGIFGSGCLLAGFSSAINLELDCTPAAYNFSFNAIQASFVTPAGGLYRWIGATSGAGQISSQAVALSPLVQWPTDSGVLSVTIASGTATLGTTLIAATTCASAVVVPATGVLNTDSAAFAFSGAPTGTYLTGLYILPYVDSSANVGFFVCNGTSGSLTPPAATLNWRVTR